MGEWTQDDLEALYLRLEKPIYNVVYRRLWDREDARDVVQEAFVRLWAMRRRILPEKVEPLVYRVALNLTRSRLRRRRLWRFMNLDAISPALLRTGIETASEASAAEDRGRLRAAIENLPVDVRDVLLLSVYGGLPYADISTTLGIPPGTVGSRRNRALRLLRESLGSGPDAAGVEDDE